MSGFSAIARARMLSNLSKGWSEHTSEQHKVKTKKFDKEYANRQRTQWDTKEHKHSVSVFKLGILVLMHVYYEDDGEISYMEKASLQNILKNEDLPMSEEEKNELLSYKESPVSKDTVISYIERYNLNQLQVKEALEIVEDVCVKPVYIDLLKQFKVYYQNR